MQLGEKLEMLRSLEGNLRGLGRALTKSEVVRLIEAENQDSISQAYLSQLESGKRPHMTEKTRDVLAKFYKVHPGFFVSDPEGWRVMLTSIREHEDRLDTWLASGVQELRGSDPELAAALQTLADHEATRSLFLLLAELVQNPRMLPALKNCLRQEEASSIADEAGKGRTKKVKSSGKE